MDLEKYLEDNEERPHNCPYTDCCSYLEYQQCHNHSHVLCRNFEIWYDSKVKDSKPKDL